jgi:hypothetical protein
VQPGALIVADRDFGHDFALLAQLRMRGIHFVLRCSRRVFSTSSRDKTIKVTAKVSSRSYR